MSALDRLKAQQANRRAPRTSTSQGTNDNQEEAIKPAAPPPVNRAAASTAGRLAARSQPPPPSQRVVAYPRHAAATSHLAGDDYMERFRDALQITGHNVDNDPYLEAHAPSQRPAAPTVARRPSGTIVPRSRTAPSNTALYTDDEPSTTMRPSWHDGPMDPAGTLCTLSERPLLCGCVDWSAREAVIGGSDHALYVVDLARGAKRRTLFGPNRGHTEWVTCCAVIDDGRIASGGMDGALLVWEKAGTRCGGVKDAHIGSVSAMQVDRSNGNLVTTGYDKTIKVWRADGAGPRPPIEMASLRGGHDAPVLVMRMDVASGHVVSGDRSGQVALWDVRGGACVRRHRQAHSGHVTAAAWCSSLDEAHGSEAESAGSVPLRDAFVTGGQDGQVCLWDVRAPTCVQQLDIHTNARGRGAVGSLQMCVATGHVVTAGADGTVSTIDVRAGWSESATVSLTNFPYEMRVIGPLALAGCGDGTVHVIDVAMGTTRYALGANKAAVRFLAAHNDTLFAAGDDGTCITYKFS